MDYRSVFVLVFLLLCGIVTGQFITETEILGPIEQNQFDQLTKLTEGMSSKARTAIDELIKIDQTSDSRKRVTRLRKVMEELDSDTIRELFELYEKTADDNSGDTFS